MKTNHYLVNYSLQNTPNEPKTIPIDISVRTSIKTRAEVSTGDSAETIYRKIKDEIARKTGCNSNEIEFILVNKL